MTTLRQRKQQPAPPQKQSLLRQESKTSSTAETGSLVSLVIIAILLVAYLSQQHFISWVEIVFELQDRSYTNRSNKEIVRTFPFRRIRGSNSNDQLEERSDKRIIVEDRPELTLDDFKVIKYLGKGEVNVGVLASVANETLARQFNLWDENKAKSHPVVIKYVDTRTLGHTEIEVFEQLLTVDKTEAAKAGLVQAVWTARDVPNPFHCGGHPCEENDRIPPGSSSSSGSHHERLGELPLVDVIVLPYYEENYILDTYNGNIESIKVFLASLMEQLALAHSVGVSCLDLQVSRNVFCHPDTSKAIVFDWNAHAPLGGYTRDPTQSWHIAAPESWLQDAFGIEARVTAIHSIDVWQVGIIFNNILYAGCKWASAKILKEGRDSEKKKFLATVIRTLAGNNNNTVIPINGKESIDLRELASLPKGKKLPVKSFKTFLDPKKRKCRNAKSWYLDDAKVSDHDKDIAIDLLKQMLVLSPTDRPTMNELLQHPFFGSLRN